MDLKKIYKRGLGVSVLLLIFIIGALFVPNMNKNKKVDKNSISLSGPDDNYEPNNIPSMAYNLSMWEDFWLSSVNGSGILEDDDFYLIEIKMGFEHLKVNLTFAHIMGNIDMEVMDFSAVVMGVSSSLTDNEYIDIILPSSGFYLIHVFGPNSSNIYDLLWKTHMFDDPYEENDDWTIAFDISGFEYTSHLGIQSDDDWYMTWVDFSERRLHVDVFHNHTEGDIDFEIYFYNGTGLIWMEWTNDTCININVPWEGWYYIRIFGENAGNQYDLRWEDALPWDDNYEENDFDGQAYDLTGYSAMWLTSVNGSALQFDEDWYLVYLDPGEERIHVEVTFWHMDGDIDVEVYYYDGGNFTYLAGSYGVSDIEHIDVNAPWYGVYYIRVYGPNFGNEYDLFWEDLMPSSTGDDWMEENDNFWSSKRIDPKYFSGLKIVGGDEDWFHIYLNPGDVIEVSIYFNHIEGDLELELYDPSYTFRDGSYSITNSEYVSYTANVPGDWRIRVYHAFSSSDVYYDLDIWLNAGGPGDDYYENNNDPGRLHESHPAILIDYEHTWLSDLHGKAVQGDEDWYVIEVSPGFEHLMIHLLFNHTLGNLDLELWFYNENTGNFFIVNGSYSLNDNENLNITGIWPGIFLIKVWGDNSGNEYDLWWDDLKTDLRPDDNYEENDNILSAYDISNNKGQSLWGINGLALQFDEDWYEIYVDETHLRLLVWLFYDSAEGLMGFEIYNDELHKIAENFTLTDHEVIKYEVSSNGTYYIRIFGDDTGNVYHLWWDTFESEGIGMIPGYNLLILIGSVVGVTTIIYKIKRRKLKQK
ncbi:MAG: PPC domain-containing protein [Candidatus Heimdallarchaeota archaeon]